MRVGPFVVTALIAAAGCSGRTLSFEKHTLDVAYRAEGVAVVDVDRDGHADLVTDEYWYAGPSFVPHEIRAPETFDPATQYAHALGVYPQDVDGDGYQDIIVAPLPPDEMFWYRNPGGADIHWDRFQIVPPGVAGLETPVVVDLFGNGRPVLLMTDSSAGLLGWYEPPADPTLPWVLNPISGAGFPGSGVFVHGIGIGDLDGDGLPDVLTGLGWFQQTTDRQTWPWHAFPFGPNACSDLRVFDADGDGLADVFCAAPHDYGFGWWRQEPAAGDGERTFTHQSIDTTLSQMHALMLDDLDGDGVPELISGKRYWAHGPDHDPGSGDPPVLALYQRRRTASGVEFPRVDLDQASGIGTSFAIGDADGDGKKDIVVSNKQGLFWFRAR